MAANAPVTQYRMETIAAFELGQSFLRISTTQEHVRQGNSAVFLVAGTGGNEAVTRGLNGLIPTAVDSNVQNTCTLTEWHDKRRRTDFDIFSSQGDGKRIMQQNTVKVLNRKIDSQILTELNTATNDTGGAVVGSMALVAKAQTILGNAEVDVEDEDNMFAVISPAMRGYLIQTTEFASGDYVDVKPLVGPARRMFRWMGINWITHSRVPGVGTNAEKCFMYHKSALGHAANSTDLDVEGGYDGEDKYYWARASLYMGAKLLQNNGVVVLNHDGSAMVAS